MSDQSLKGLTILWTEDDAFLAEFIMKTLRQSGAEVKYAKDGEQALEMLKEEDPDVALVDLMLPGVDGWSVIEYIRGEERFNNVPIVVFSNLGDEEDINKGMELGADRFIVKSSISPEELVDEIKAGLEDRKGN